MIMRWYYCTAMRSVLTTYFLCVSIRCSSIATETGSSVDWRTPCHVTAIGLLIRWCPTSRTVRWVTRPCCPRESVTSSRSTVASKWRQLINSSMECATSAPRRPSTAKYVSVRITAVVSCRGPAKRTFAFESNIEYQIESNRLCRF